MLLLQNKTSLGREKNYLRLHLQRLEDLNPREIEKEEEEREKYLW